MDRRIPSKRLLRSEDSGSKRLRRGLESGAGNSSKVEGLIKTETDRNR
jgi:hypothetical protein